MSSSPDLHFGASGITMYSRRSKCRMNSLHHCQKDIWRPTEVCLQGKCSGKSPCHTMFPKKVLSKSDARNACTKKHCMQYKVWPAGGAIKRVIEMECKRRCEKVDASVWPKHGRFFRDYIFNLGVRKRLKKTPNKIQQPARPTTVSLWRRNIPPNAVPHTECQRAYRKRERE